MAMTIFISGGIIFVKSDFAIRSSGVISCSKIGISCVTTSSMMGVSMATISSIIGMSESISLATTGISLLIAANSSAASGFSATSACCLNI